MVGRMSRRGPQRKAKTFHCGVNNLLSLTWSVENPQAGIKAGFYPGFEGSTADFAEIPFLKGKGSGEGKNN